MARQTGILQFTGKLGNLIGYRRNGRYFMRSMPETVRQTTATRRAGRDFGIASTKGKLIRRAILPALEVSHDGALVNRLNKVLIRSGKEQLQSLEGFRWNRHTGISSFFAQPPVITANGRVKIPAQQIPPVGSCTHLEVSAIAVRIDFTERRITGRHTASLHIDLNKPFDGAELEATVPGKGTLLLLLQVRAAHGNVPSMDRRYMAADILRITSHASRRKTTKTPDVKKWGSYAAVSGSSLRQRKNEYDKQGLHAIALLQRE